MNGVSPRTCARDLLAAVPVLMGFIREHMRSNRGTGLSIPQFRALICVHQHDDTSLSALAEHVGLSLPAASRMVDLLVRRGLVARQARPADRRSVSLSLTAAGRTTFRRALRATQQAIAGQFEMLSGRELGSISSAMQILQAAFVENGRSKVSAEPNGGSAKGGTRPAPEPSLGGPPVRSPATSHRPARGVVS